MITVLFTYFLYLLGYVLAHNMLRTEALDVLSGRWDGSGRWVVVRRRQSSKQRRHSLPKMLQDEELEFDVVQSWWGGEEKKVLVITIIQVFRVNLKRVSLRCVFCLRWMLTQVHCVCCLCGLSCPRSVWTSACWPVVSSSPSCLFFFFCFF